MSYNNAKKIFFLFLILNLMLFILIHIKTYQSAEELLRKKQKKQILNEGAAKFNENPKLGLRFLEGKKLYKNRNLI